MPLPNTCIVGIGIDVVATDRIARVLDEQREAFEERVFTAAERETCAGRADRVHALGARLAAKEACGKALGTGLGQGVAFQHIEVVENAAGKPELRLSGAAAARAQALGVRRIHVSLTHDDGVSAAVVVLEGQDLSPPG